MKEVHTFLQWLNRNDVPEPLTRGEMYTEVKRWETEFDLPIGFFHDPGFGFVEYTFYCQPHQLHPEILRRAKRFNLQMIETFDATTRFRHIPKEQKNVRFNS